MKDLTLTQKAVIMAMTRLIHRQRVTVTNVSIALEMKLAATKVEAQRLCLDLGLYPWGKKGCTDLKVMNDHIGSKREAQLRGERSHLSVIASGLPDRVSTAGRQNIRTVRLLTNLSIEKGLSIRTYHCPRFGTVKAYHIDVISEFKRKYIT